MAVIGYDVIGSGTGDTADNWSNEATVATGRRYVASSGDRATMINVYGANSGDCEVGIYVYSGGVPTTRVAAFNVTIGATAQWHQQAIDVALTAGVEYCVAIDYFQAASWQMRYDTLGGTQTSIGAGTSALPSTWSQSTTSGDIISYYVEVTAGGGLGEGAASGTIAWVGSATGDNFEQDPVSYVKEVGNVTNTTAGTTSSITVAAGGVPVDDHVVIYGACDNTGASGAATTITVTDTRGNTYTTQTPQAIADPGAASAGIQGFFAIAKITTALQAGDTITITYGNSTAAKAISAQQFHGVHLTTPVLASSYARQDNQSGTTPSVATTPNAAGQAVLALVAVEGGTADSFTQDSDTTNGSWVTLTRRGSGTTTSGATLNAVYKIVTASGTQTYNPTLGTARDQCAAILVLAFEPIAPPTKNGAGNGNIAWVGSATGITSKFGAANGAFTKAGVATSTFSIRYPVSVSGRKILDQNGKPYFIRTFSSWKLVNKLSNADITTALESVAANGFNGVTVWTGGIEDRANEGDQYTNQAGQNFWTGTPWRMNSGTTLGPAWASVDHAISECARLGLVYHFSFCAGAGTEGAGPDWESATDADMHAVGVALATRYASSPNIVWHCMFDDGSTPGSTRGLRLRALFDGINDTEGTGARPVRWCEANNGSTTSDQGWFGTGSETRFSINSGYSYLSDSVVQVEGWYSQSSTLGAGSTPVPTADSEPPYDGAGHYSGNQGQQLRERSWACVIEGLVGINYGQEDWWPFGGAGLFSEGLDWTDVQTHDHTVQQSYIWDLISYVEDTTWAPATVIDNGSTGEGTTDTKAAQGRSDTAALVYFPSNRTVTVDTNLAVGSSVQLRWYDPVTGGFTSIAASETSQTGRSVTIPAARGDGTRDFVLVIDAIVPNDGAGSGAISWAGSATGTRQSRGASTGAISWVGSATGTRVGKGAGNGAISWVGFVLGGNLGLAIGSISWAGVAEGDAPTIDPKQGAASGTISWVGSATGKRVPAGAGTGAISWVGTAVGGNLGVAIGSIQWVGSATGTRSPKGAGTGAIGWAGSASGFAPTPGENDGAGFGTISWAGSAAGLRMSKGAVIGTITWAGTAVGGNLGVGIGSIGWAGFAQGIAPTLDIKNGAGIGTITWIGSGTGTEARRGEGTGTITWSGFATSFFTVPPETFLLVPHVSGYIPEIIVGYKPGRRS